LTPHGNGFCFFTRLWAKTFQNLYWNFLFGEALDFHHEAFFIQAHQADSLPAGAGAASPTNAVHVVF